MNFYSRGKLLLSGEYLVLMGATALAVPLKYGQELEVKQTGRAGQLSWESKVQGKPWFSARYMLPFFDTIESSDPETANNLKTEFVAVVEMEPGFAEKASGAMVETTLDFKREWGFGSSSTHLVNLASWAGVDPFILHAKVSKGSGYDVVAAQQDGPFYFSSDGDRYSTEAIDMHPQVCNGIYFVYLGQKAKSSVQVDRFLKRRKSYRLEIKLIADLSRHLGNSSTLEDFGYYMKEHEVVMASILKQPMIKEQIFHDFQGEAKSLGAWGGDFAMITWNDSKAALKHYLETKQLKTFFAYNDLVIKR